MLANHFLSLQWLLEWRYPLPRTWVDAIVIGIYKGQKTDPANFRPMFFLDTRGQLYASILCRPLKIHLTTKLPRTQCGFREGRSTEKAIFGVGARIQQALDQKKELGLVFVQSLWFDIDCRYRKLYVELDSSWNLMHSVKSLLNCHSYDRGVCRNH